MVGGHASKDKKQTRMSSWWINHSGSVPTKCIVNLVGIVIDKYTTGFSKRFDMGIYLTLSSDKLWQKKGP